MAVLVASLGAAEPGLAVSFMSWRQAPYRGQSLSLDAADFNRDGYDDLAVVSVGGGLVRLFLADGEGSFALPHSQAGVVLHAFQVLARDFTGDGNPDVAVVYEDGGLWVFAGDGQGNLAAGRRYDTQATSPPQSMASIDFDRDGDTDIAVALLGGSITGRVQLMANDGAGGFAPVGPAVAVGRVPGDTTAGDFDGDGHADVAVTNNLDRTATVVFGDGAGGLADAHTVATNANAPPQPGELSEPEPWGVAAADFNGDGIDDLFVANGVWDPFAGPAAAVARLTTQFVEGAAYGNAALFLGSPNRTLSAPTYLPVDNWAVDLRVGDFNGDGRLDIAAAGDSVLTLISRPDGTYARHHGSGGGGVSLAMGYFNADRLVDFAVVGLGSTLDFYLSLPGYDVPGPFYLRPQRNAENEPQHYGTTDLAAADLNNDGLPDLVTPTGRGRTVEVFLGAGDGDFSSPIASVMGSDVARFAIGDFDRNGCADAVLRTVEPGGRGPLVLFTGDCHGHLRFARQVADDIEYSLVVAADLNADGAPDLVTTGNRFDPANPLGGFLGTQVLLNDGAGTFRISASLNTRKNTVDLFVADLNADEHQDLVLVNSSDISVHLGLADGAFAAPLLVPSPTGRQNVTSAALADFDEDGILDLAASFPGDPTQPFGPFWLRGDGTGAFVDPVHLIPEHVGLNSQGAFVGLVTTRDVTGDGHADIVLGSQHGVTVFEGNGNGTFAPASPHFGTHNGCNPDCRPAVADFNGDGLADFASISSALDVYGQTDVVITLLFNDTPPDPILAGDANCDRQVTEADLPPLLRQLFSPLHRPACKGNDANGDGFVTAADLIATALRLGT